jgi:NAD+ diphosphatase
MTHSAAFSTAFLSARYPEPDRMPGNARWMIVRGNGVFVSAGTPATILFSGDPEKTCPVLRAQYLGHRDTVPLYAVETNTESSVRGCTFSPNIRELHGILPDDELALAAFAVRIVDFNRTARFCGQCGAPTRQSGIERAKCCDACGMITYPRTSPAIIVLIRNGDNVLLARSPRFPPGMYSIIAGFVEPAETLEEAVRREVWEEVGLEVTNIRYYGSEPWPFPNSLMIGFVADYAGGRITIDNNEIVAAGWFDREHLPTLPSPLSISRALINRWIGNNLP